MPGGDVANAEDLAGVRPISVALLASLLDAWEAAEP